MQDKIQQEQGNEAMVDNLSEIFPNINRQIISNALRDSGYDLGFASELLLKQQKHREMLLKKLEKEDSSEKTESPYDGTINIFKKDIFSCQKQQTNHETFRKH